MLGNLNTILTKYKQNMDRQRELDAMLLADLDKEEWISCLQNRATENQAMYSENGFLIEQLEELLKSELTAEESEKLYEEAYAMYWDGYDDCQVLLPMLYKLIAYYKNSEDGEDISKLLFVYGAVYYEENEVQNRREGKQSHDETYNYKILEYKDRYFELSEEARRRIWGTYYNLIVSGLGNKAITPDQSYELYKEALDFWNTPKVQELDGTREDIKSVIDRIINEWLIVEENIEEAREETKAVFCKEAVAAFEKEMKEEGDILKINSEVYGAYLHAKVLLKQSTMDEIVDEYLAYYVKKMELCPEPKEMTDEDFYFIINTPLTIENWMKYGISEEKKKTIINELKTMTRETWYYKLNKYDTPFLNSLMAEWCFKLMKYFDSQDEKEEWIFQLLVRRQLPTYLHSVMVMHLAEALCKEVKRSRPELFDSLEQIRKDEVVNFVRQCALLHDVGKTRITDIVNTQGRKLWDREFQGIKLHPSYGAEMLDTDSDLFKYRDVALGHHKFYDGSSGYPEDFDNVHSPYRIVIDLITICDCIDAATDHLGRNYKKAKTLDMVLEELSAGKGVRYNPDLVELIENSPRLRKEMSYIVRDGRLDIMYRAYLESVL